MDDREEKRKFFRYEISEMLFLVFARNSRRLGMVRNISMGGVAFEYIVYDDTSPSVYKGDRIEINMFKRDWEFFVEKIPCKIVYDVQTENDFNPYSYVKTRCCGLQFSDLNEKQRKKLVNLVFMNAKKIVPKGPYGTLISSEA